MPSPAGQSGEGRKEVSLPSLDERDADGYLIDSFPWQCLACLGVAQLPLLVAGAVLAGVSTGPDYISYVVLTIAALELAFYPGYVFVLRRMMGAPFSALLTICTGIYVTTSFAFFPVFATWLGDRSYANDGTESGYDTSSRMLASLSIALINLVTTPLSGGALARGWYNAVAHKEIDADPV